MGNDPVNRWDLLGMASMNDDDYPPPDKDVPPHVLPKLPVRAKPWSSEEERRTSRTKMLIREAQMMVIRDYGSMLDSLMNPGHPGIHITLVVPSVKTLVRGVGTEPNKTKQKEKVPLEWLKKLCGSQSGRDFVRDMATGYSVYLTEHSVIGGFGVAPMVNGAPTNDIFISRTISPQVLSYFNRFYGFTGDEANFQIATLAHERGHTINHGSGRPITGNGNEAFARFYGDLVADSLGLSPLYPSFGFNYADYVGVVNWDVSHGNSGKSSIATEYRGPTISSNALDRIKGLSSLLGGWDCARLKAEGGQ